MGFLTEMISNITYILASNMLVQNIIARFLPPQLLHLLLPILGNFLPRFSTHMTMVVEAYDGVAVNGLYNAAETFLPTKISRSNIRLNVRKPAKEKGILVTIDNGEKIVDVFDGVKITWRIGCSESKRKNPDPLCSKYGGFSTKHTPFFELSFNKIHMDKVLNSYLPHILDWATARKNENTPVRIFTVGSGFERSWSSVVLDHPSTFQTLAMEETQKTALINDLKRFVERKQFYRQVGKAWKRGYLLYGPPGTGKSSLIAAMANFLHFNIYDLDLTNVSRNSDLKSLLMAVSDKSILVIEDIDCMKQLKERKQSGAQTHNPSENGMSTIGSRKMTLSGILNFVDGLWSSCGDERIIIFTTNHKEKLDPALLRPGRMDMHLYMGYCSFAGFTTLASNYLGIHDHPLFEHIRDLLEKVRITPAEVAEEFMRSEADNPDSALQILVDALQRKKKGKEVEMEDCEPVEVEEDAEEDEKAEE